MFGGRGRGRFKAPEPQPEGEGAQSVAQPTAAAEPVQGLQQTLTGMQVSDTGAAAADQRPAPTPTVGLGRGFGRGRGRGLAVLRSSPREPDEESASSVAEVRTSVAGQFEDAPEVPAPVIAASAAPREPSGPGSSAVQLGLRRPQGTGIGAQSTSAKDGSEISRGVVHPQVSSSSRDGGAFSRYLPHVPALPREREEEPEKTVRMGSKGQPLKLKTNYLRLSVMENRPGIVEYHVSFSKPVESVRNRRHILLQFKDELGSVMSFDGMMLFLPIFLTGDIITLEGTDPLDAEDPVVQVTISYVKIKSLHDWKGIQFCNILLNRIMREMQYVELRREFYDLTKIQVYNQHKLQVWPGKDVSAAFQEEGLMVCVSTCNRVLRTDTVYEYYKLIRNDPDARRKMNEFIINKIVLTRYNNKCYKIDEVAWNSNPTETFEWHGETITYADYLKKQYNVTVKDLKQPMLLSKLKPRKNEIGRLPEGLSERMAALIPECCFITGLTEDQRKDFKVMTDLAASTRLTPVQRMTQLTKFEEEVKSHKVASTLLKDWGLKLETVIEVDARRADGPDMIFNNRTKTEKTGPDFSREATKAVYEPITVKQFVVLCTQRDADKANRFIDTYHQVAAPLGIKMPQKGRIVTTTGMKAADFDRALKQHCDSNDIQFVVIIMPMQNDDTYRAIKTHCVATKPIPSQCIVSRTLENEKRLRSIVLKIALQINCKLGGGLWAMTMPLKTEIMFVGIDSAHDPLKRGPSVMCLVASMNNECTKYFSKGTTAATHDELATELKQMMSGAMENYLKTRGRFPDQIVVYRDGGSEGALDTMRYTEGTQIREAVKGTMKEATLPKLTYVVVNKRINQRFFFEERKNIFSNPPPGTIVDNTVTRRDQFDYYVVSQKVGQGTVNPTHFVVLDPSDPIKPDLIQKMSYATCFMYYNWSGTVRVPAMVQYAHKMASLLSKSVNGKPHDSIANTLYYL